MRKKLIILGASALMSIPALAGTAFAAYGQQPGFTVANGNTECAGHGAFGAFGNFGDVHHDFGVNDPGTNGRPGASNWQYPATNGGTTAQNNSSLCGNEASPPPFTP